MKHKKHKKHNIPHAVLAIGTDRQPYIIISKKDEKMLKKFNK